MTPTLTDRIILCLWVEPMTCNRLADLSNASVPDTFGTVSVLVREALLSDDLRAGNIIIYRLATLGRCRARSLLESIRQKKEDTDVRPTAIETQ